MEKLKIIIERKNKGICVDITGENTDKNIIASILLKVFLNFCKATDLDVEDLLDKLSKD